MTRARFAAGMVTAGLLIAAFGALRTGRDVPSVVWVPGCEDAPFVIADAVAYRDSDGSEPLNAVVEQVHRTVYLFPEPSWAVQFMRRLGVSVKQRSYRLRLNGDTARNGQGLMRAYTVVATPVDEERGAQK